MTPTARTVKWLEAQGYLADVCERRITRTLKRDLFGVFDIVASSPSVPILAVQCTTLSNFSARLRKVTTSAKAQQLLRQKWQIAVVGWGDSGVPRVYWYWGDGE